MKSNIFLVVIFLLSFWESESFTDNSDNQESNAIPKYLDEETVVLNNGGSCENNFEGFGVHLGALTQLNTSSEAVIQQVAHLIYNDLQLRYFRTEYFPFFSPSEDTYDISCKEPYSCTWNTFHKAMAGFPDAKYFASIWSPPHYMKNVAYQLKSEYEEKYYYFIKNITALFEKEFGQKMEIVSPVNEPENFMASWDHCNMGPQQLCGMVQKFNDPLISACTENSWYSTTKIYMSHSNEVVSCAQACKTVLTHAYTLNYDPKSSEFLNAYYDKEEHAATFTKPVWMTEVSSTYSNAEENQMGEALDLAMNVVHFVGTTCVTRYYFWSAYNGDPTGEALIWGNATNDTLTFPKKYFVYRHFTAAAHAHKNAKVSRCDDKYFDGPCIQFGETNAAAVFVNARNASLPLKTKCRAKFCCTDEKLDHICSTNFDQTVLPLSVCSCSTFDMIL